MNKVQSGNTSIDTLCKLHNVNISRQAQQTISKFTYLYARQFIKKCIIVRPSLGNLSKQDILDIYHAQKGVKCPVLEVEQVDKKRKTIQSINKTYIKNYDPNNESPQPQQSNFFNVQTVRIMNEDFSHLQTFPNFQLSFTKDHKNH